MNSNWELRKKDQLFHNPYVGVEKWSFVSDGQEKQFDMFIAYDAVIVFALTADNEVLLLKQYFFSSQKTHYTLVAGIVDDGEEIEKTAERELMEEAGAKATEWVHLGSSMRGKWVIGTLHFFLATGVEQVQEPELDGSEELEPVTMSMEEFKVRLASSEIEDVGSVACAYRALDYLSHSHNE